jgi:hypothetical protein
VVIGERGLKEGQVEFQGRTESTAQNIPLASIKDHVMAAVQAETTANITELSEVIMSKFMEFEKTIKKKYGLTDFKDYDDQGLKKYLIDAYTYEALAALSSHPEALGWYDEKITNAMAIMSLIYPELTWKFTDKLELDKLFNCIDKFIIDS